MPQAAEGLIPLCCGSLLCFERPGHCADRHSALRSSEGEAFSLGTQRLLKSKLVFHAASAFQHPAKHNATMICKGYLLQQRLKESACRSDQLWKCQTFVFRRRSRACRRAPLYHTTSLTRIATFRRVHHPFVWLFFAAGQLMISLSMPSWLYAGVQEACPVLQGGRQGRHLCDSAGSKAHREDDCVYSWQCTNIFSRHSGCGESAILQWQASILQQGEQFCLSSCLFCPW